jgi:hypothetical protein
VRHSRYSLVVRASFAADEKLQKKLTKKACQHSASPLDREFERQTPGLAVQKKFEKSEKKACQPFRNLITLPKPNQTNGETND